MILQQQQYLWDFAGKIDVLLKAQVEREAPVDSPHCMQCQGGRSAHWRCRDCIVPQILCRGCMRRTHMSNPFHWIERWTGKYFRRTSLQEVGIYILINHRVAGLCDQLKIQRQIRDEAESSADQQDMYADERDMSPANIQRPSQTHYGMGPTAAARTADDGRHESTGRPDIYSPFQTQAGSDGIVSNAGLKVADEDQVERGMDRPDVETQFQPQAGHFGIEPTIGARTADERRQEHIYRPDIYTPVQSQAGNFGIGLTAGAKVADDDWGDQGMDLPDVETRLLLKARHHGMGATVGARKDDEGRHEHIQRPDIQTPVQCQAGNSGIHLTSGADKDGDEHGIHRPDILTPLESQAGDYGIGPSDDTNPADEEGNEEEEVGDTMAALWNEFVEGHTQAPISLTGVDEICVVHTNGVHALPVILCECHGKDELLSDIEYAGFLPTSFTRVSTLFTNAVLDDFRIANLECKVTIYQYWQRLRRITSPMTPSQVPNRYKELGHMSRIWRWMKKLKWAGFAQRPERKAGDVRDGELTIFCPACPQPGININ